MNMQMANMNTSSKSTAGLGRFGGGTDDSTNVKLFVDVGHVFYSLCLSTFIQTHNDICAYTYVFLILHEFKYVLYIYITY